MSVVVDASVFVAACRPSEQWWATSLDFIDAIQQGKDEAAAPTLLLVGGDDMHVLELNRAALEKLTCVKALEVVPGATHLFEEPGTLERVADSSADWFRRHLSG